MAGGIDFGHSIRLVGSRLDRVPGAQPGVIDVTLIWEAIEAPLPDCNVSLQLLDDTAHTVATRDKPPLFGLRPCSQWRAGEIIRDHQQIRLPPGAPPGRYQLGLRLTLGGQTVAPATEGTSGTSPQVILGVVDAAPPPGSVRLPDSYAVGAPVGDIASLDAARVLRRDPGGTASIPASDSRFVARLEPRDHLEVDLLWRAIADAPTDYAIFVQRLDAGQRRAAQHDSWPLAGAYLTVDWDPGDTIYDETTVPIPPNLTPGEYPVEVGLYELKTGARLAAPDGATSIVIGTLSVR